MLDIGRPQIQLLEKLCNAVGVSGDEAEVRQIVLDEVKSFADEIRIDAMGSVLVRKKGSSRNPLRVQIDAHMDEVGFMMVHEDGEGFYQFERIGSVDARLWPGKQVQVGRHHQVGVIGVKPHHLTAEEEFKRAIPESSLLVDLGQQGTAHVGDRGTFVSYFHRAGSSIISKAIDDRIGVAILIELLKHAPSQIELCLSFSVQEEIGLRGAKIAAHYFDPDLAIAVDATPARDLPDYAGRENTTYNTRLGYGPAIYISNSTAIDDPRLIRFLERTAIRAGIPYQFRQPGPGGTDAGSIQQSRAGVPVISVSVPHRYAHSPASIARVADWKNTLNLLYLVLKNLNRRVLDA